jgi:hypothetical protein
VVGRVEELLAVAVDVRAATPRLRLASVSNGCGMTNTDVRVSK